MIDLPVLAKARKAAPAQTKKMLSKVPYSSIIEFLLWLLQCDTHNCNAQGASRLLQTVRVGTYLRRMRIAISRTAEG